MKNSTYAMLILILIAVEAGIAAISALADLGSMIDFQSTFWKVFLPSQILVLNALAGTVLFIGAPIFVMKRVRKARGL